MITKNIIKDCWSLFCWKNSKSTWLWWL